MTSLAEQLKKLATPQTSLLLQDKKKPSLLFDPKEAANLDRDTVFEIGLTGFEDLKKLNPQFSKYENILFDVTSRAVERAVESQKTNEQLNKNIRGFLILLSPYFLLKPSHQALEWLISRFHIPQFNKDDLMFLILPYHDTNMFVRVLQLMDISSPTDKWHWLYSLQKPGIPLVKAELLKHCVADPSFLRWLCDETMEAVKVHGAGAHTLTTLFAFTCTTVLGTLEKTTNLTEVHFTHVLPAILKGLSSPLVDFVATAYMILAQLAVKVEISQNALVTIINKIVTKCHPSLRREAAQLLLVLYQAQAGLESFPSPALSVIAVQPWLLEELEQQSLSGANIIPLLMPLVTSTLRTIRSKPADVHQLKSFTHNLLTRITLGDDGAKVTIRAVIECFDTGSSEDSSKVKDQSWVKWYSDTLKSLERQYPTVFDCTAQSVLKVARNKSKLRIVLGLDSELDIFEKLNHPVAKIRQKTVEYIVSNFGELKVKHRQLLSSNLLNLLGDCSLQVVAAVLELPAESLAELVGPTSLLEKLLELAGKQTPENPTTCKLLQHLTSRYVAKPGPSDVRVLLAVLPFLFPSKDSDIVPAQEILVSEFGARSKLLRLVKKDLGDIRSVRSANAVCAAVWRRIIRVQCLPNVDLLLDSFDKIAAGSLSVAQKFLGAVVLVCAAPQQNPVVCWSVLQRVVTCLGDCKVTALADEGSLTAHSISACISRAQEGSVTVQGYLFCLSMLMSKVQLPDQLQDSCWLALKSWDDPVHVSVTSILIRVYDVLVRGCTTVELASLYVLSLKDFFQRYFPEERKRLQFLGSLFAACRLSKNDTEGKASELVTPELQIHALRITTALIEQWKVLPPWVLQPEANRFIPALLVALYCPLSPIRLQALACVFAIVSRAGSGSIRGVYCYLLEEVLNMQREIEMDAEQLPLHMYTVLSPDPAVQSLLKPEVRKHTPRIRTSLLDCVTDAETPGHVSLGLLKVLENVNSEEVFRKLVPLGTQTLSRHPGQEMSMCDSAIFISIMQHFNQTTASCLSSPECFEFIRSALLDYKTAVWDENHKPLCPALIVLEQLSRELFASLPPGVQNQLLQLIVAVSTEADASDVVSAGSRVVKKIILDAAVVVPELEKMRDLQPVQPQAGTRRARRPLIPSVDLLETAPWRRGVTLLEFLHTKKKLNSVHRLLPVLFDVLKKCLEFEEQEQLEYTKQLLLSCILHCCQKLSPDGSPVSPELVLAERTFNMELVVQCIRVSPNPQTHHHALLVLSHTAGMIPEQVLHNMMSIFTFMGSSILRHDDSYSFQIISKIMETVIPILIKAGETGALPSAMSGRLASAVAKVLRVFCDALLDVPEHRRLPLYHKLLTISGPAMSLWLLLCLVFESHVAKGSDDSQIDKGDLPKRLEFALSLAQMFPPDLVIPNCVRLMEYIMALPVDKDDSSSQKGRRLPSLVPGAECDVEGLLDVEHCSGKQLRHFKYTLSSFLSSLLSSPHFVTQVVVMNEKQVDFLKENFREVLEKMLSYIQAVNRVCDGSSSKPTSKYWKVMLNQAYDILDKVNALLPADMFLSVIHGLLDHPLLTVRRKAMDLFNSKLQHQTDFLLSCQQDSLLALVEPLMAAVKTVGTEHNLGVELELNQQTALVSIKLLARALGDSNPDRFKEILDIVASFLNNSNCKGNVLASVVLCVAEVAFSLKAHAISSMNKFLPRIINILDQSQSLESPDLLLFSVVSALHKVMETLPNFISPFLTMILFHVSYYSSKWGDTEIVKHAPLIQKLKLVRQKISSTPLRLLVPSTSECYSLLLEKRLYSSVGPLLEVMSDHFSNMAGNDFNSMKTEISAFFICALQFRTDCSISGLDVSMEDVVVVETHVVKTFVALVLKLSEMSFKPLYFNLFHWATSSKTKNDRLITFYRLTSSIAECLKGLFVNYSGHFLKSATQLLDSNNLCKSETLHYGSGKEAELKAISLIEHIMKTLHSVCLYDNQNFFNKERFEMMMQPMVDQLENMVGGMEAYKTRMSEVVIPCLAQFAVAVADETLWKQMNYQILLKMRHANSQIRLTALSTVSAMAHKLGEDYLVVMPEVIPFLAELMEDEEEEVERACRTAVQDLEVVVGEPLQKYF